MACRYTKTERPANLISQLLGNDTVEDTQRIRNENKRFAFLRLRASEHVANHPSNTFAEHENRLFQKIDELKNTIALLLDEEPTDPNNTAGNSDKPVKIRGVNSNNMAKSAGAIIGALLTPVIAKLTEKFIDMIKNVINYALTIFDNFMKMVNDVINTIRVFVTVTIPQYIESLKKKTIGLYDKYAKPIVNNVLALNMLPFRVFLEGAKNIPVVGPYFGKLESNAMVNPTIKTAAEYFSEGVISPKEFNEIAANQVIKISDEIFTPLINNPTMAPLVKNLQTTIYNIVNNKSDAKTELKNLSSMAQNLIPHSSITPIDSTQKAPNDTSTPVQQTTKANINPLAISIAPASQSFGEIVRKPQISSAISKTSTLIAEPESSFNETHVIVYAPVISTTSINQSTLVSVPYGISSNPSLRTT